VPWLAIALAACQAASHQAGRGQAEVTAWLTCVECDRGQLDTVVQLGRQAVTHAAVVSALQAADTGAAFAPALRLVLEQEYAADSADAAGSLGVAAQDLPTRAVWVSRHLKGRLTVRQVRAGLALQLIAAPPP
jgi:hypothetical protein